MSSKKVLPSSAINKNIKPNIKKNAEKIANAVKKNPGAIHKVGIKTAIGADGKRHIVK